VGSTERVLFNVDTCFEYKSKGVGGDRCLAAMEDPASTPGGIPYRSFASTI